MRDGTAGDHGLPPVAATPPVRLVATDLDGTLLRPDGSVSPRTVQAVLAARAAGVHVVPVTGRPPHVTWDIARQAGVGPYGVCSNGAAVIDIVGQSIVEVVHIGADVALGFITMLRELFPDALFALEGLGVFTHETGFMDSQWAWAALDEHLVEVPDIAHAVGTTSYKLIMRRPGRSAREVLAELRREVAESGHITSSGFDWVEIGAPGISKAYAVERVCHRLGVRTAEVLAVGDNHNDLPVLAWAAQAAAPANAIPEVISAVDRVLPANDEDGVAQLLEEVAEQALALRAATDGPAGRPSLRPAAAPVHRP